MSEEYIQFLNYIEYKEGYKYQLGTTYHIKLKVNPKKEFDRDFLRLTKDGILTMRNGYAWDGPSGPTIDTRSSMRGSLVHDALYQLMRMRALPQSYRKHADSIFLDILLDDDMNELRANAWYISVCSFASSSADPKNLRKMLVAP